MYKQNIYLYIYLYICKIGCIWMQSDILPNDGLSNRYIFIPRRLEIEESGLLCRLNLPPETQAFKNLPAMPFSACWLFVPRLTSLMWLSQLSASCFTHSPSRKEKMQRTSWLSLCITEQNPSQTPQWNFASSHS